MGFKKQNMHFSKPLMDDGLCCDCDGKDGIFVKDCGKQVLVGISTLDLFIYFYLEYHLFYNICLSRKD